LHVSVNSENKKVEREILKENGGIFMKFGWMPDPFNAGSTARARQSEINNYRSEKTNPRPFNPAKNKKMSHYDYPFLGVNEKSAYSFLSSQDPY
jgi:hypothetical protein